MANDVFSCYIKDIGAKTEISMRELYIRIKTKNAKRRRFLLIEKDDPEYLEHQRGVCLEYIENKFQDDIAKILEGYLFEYNTAMIREKIVSEINEKIKYFKFGSDEDLPCV